jgi:hypothetical protein
MAALETVIVDTDIVIDHLANRMPFAEFAHRISGLLRQAWFSWWSRH